MISEVPIRRTVVEESSVLLRDVIELPMAEAQKLTLIAAREDNLIVTKEVRLRLVSAK